MQKTARYQLKFGLDYGTGTFLWANSPDAHKAYGYAVVLRELPVPTTLQRRAEFIAAWWDTFLDWEQPPQSTAWWPQEAEQFKTAIVEILDLLDEALGSDFSVAREPQLGQLLERAAPIMVGEQRSPPEASK